MRLPEIHRRGAALVMVGVALAGLLFGLGLNLVSTPTWTSTTTVLVESRPSDVLPLLLGGAPDDLATEDLSDVAALVTSSGVLQRVAADLEDPPSLDDLRRDLTATPVTATHLVSIQATAEDEQDADALAGAAAAAVVADQQAAVQALVADLPASSAARDVRLRAQILTGRLTPVVVLDSPTATQTSPSLRTPLALAVVGLALGGLVVIGLSLGRVQPRRGPLEPS